MNHMEHDNSLDTLEHLARIGAIQEHSKWSSWGSPVGLIIFFNGMALMGILIRFAIIMK
jgi:hypothetical protein